MAAPILTDRLCLRPYRPQDVEPIHNVLYGDAKVRRLTGGVSSLAETRATIESYIAAQERIGYAYWGMIERSTGHFVGEAGLKPLDDEGPEVELGYALGTAYWGRGYATEAARAVLAEAFGPLGFKRVFATAREENTDSRHVLSKLGFASAQSASRPSGLLCFVLEQRQ